MRRDTVYQPPEDNFRMVRSIRLFGSFTYVQSSDESDQSTTSSQLELDLNAAREPSDDEQEDADIPLTTKEKIIAYARLILPHVALVLVLLVYLLIGAAIFQRIEGPNEIITKNYEIQTILGLRDQFQESIWNLTHNSDTVISRETFNGLGQEYFEKMVRKHSRRISYFHRNRTQSQSGRSDAESSGTKAGSINLNTLPEEEVEDPGQKQPLRIPIVMVLVVILSYTALGGLLFQKFEGWPYMEAFYFCFITTATIGFGDYVPTKQVYIFFTMIYIIFGLALATMCIDTAGTHYIQKIHYVGTKMEDAKGAVMTGLQHSEEVLKHKGIEIIKTAGGKIYKVRGAMLSKTQARELDYLLRSSQYQQKNILYEPLPPAVARLIREKGIKVLPDEINETEGYIVQNRDYEKQVTKQFLQQQRSPNTIHRFIRRPGRPDAAPALMPFVLKESNI
ncbi:TWiK family of potassium channels protein 7 [Aphelenchoides fujianensis]|nr:TWiK family of potassium channels protein 7 [Aphelenchoides fujianensis]